MAEFEFPSGIDRFLNQVQKAALPGVWSKGVKQSRDGGVQLEKVTAQEIVAKVRYSDRPVSARVQLWPEDEDYFCDCSEKANPCYHVAACIASLKSGQFKSETSPARGATLRYRFRRVRSSDGRNRLAFERILSGEPFLESLTSYVGGIHSGRISGTNLSPTQEDYSIDALIGAHCPSRNPEVLSKLFQDAEFLKKLLPLLQDNSELALDTESISIGKATTGLQAEVLEEDRGFRLVAKPQDPKSELFSNGFILVNHQIRTLINPDLNEKQRQMLAEPGTFFSSGEAQVLVTDILPALDGKITIKIGSSRLPQVDHSPPTLRLDLMKHGEDELRAAVSIGYRSSFSLKDLPREQMLLRAIQSELHLVPGHWARFTGFQAIDFVSRARKFFEKNSEYGSISGDGVTHFQNLGDLKVHFSLDSKSEGFGMQVHFTLSGRKADTSRVLAAWRNGESLVPLLDGGYASIPAHQLSKSAASLSRLLELKEKGKGVLPHYAVLEAVILAEELGATTEHSEEKIFQNLRTWIDEFREIPPATVYQDLKVELRNYQKTGVDWLCFLRDSRMGALLADDMGLGKTLQALCALRGKSLIVAPASVLHSWAEQAQRFFPKLKINLYHGSQRSLEDSADLTITSYGVLRQDQPLLERKWDCAVLDESQTIKNPDSQIAKAAHRIQAGFRLALSGTPVENRLDDLWSSFEFINPGLLGSRRAFQEEWASPIQRGDAHLAARLKKRIKPFILRRLKREVAPELPPKTEVLLHCELSEHERELYNTLLASTRREVLEKLETGSSVLGALELLLRLRQASSHPALVPGQVALSSSKLDLLLENLETTVSEGHRALVFSQWTSMLDLIEPRLSESGISYLRLDGSTTDRSSVVDQFQSQNGPPVLLLSLKAGGVGLTLTAADYVFLMDSWWNPAVEDQAADRVHRIGQDKPVLICRLVTRDTVEEKILALQQRKKNLADSIIGSSGVSGSSSLSREDLLFLLQ